MKRLILAILLIFHFCGCGSSQPVPLTPLEEYSIALQVWNTERLHLEELKVQKERGDNLGDELNKQERRLTRAKRKLSEADAALGD